jgi:hypothetical protein
MIVAIQFFRPARVSGQVTEDISTVLPVSNNVKLILANACYDCHSNNPRYPWYFNVQPIGWLLSRHIDEGREELNFSEFGNYSAGKQSEKLEHIVHTINENEMPLKSYRLMHKEARLSNTEKKILIDWAKTATH